jgi:hypothetical protein
MQTAHGEILVMDSDTRTQHSLGSVVALRVAVSDVRWVADDSDG